MCTSLQDSDASYVPLDRMVHSYAETHEGENEGDGRFPYPGRGDNVMVCPQIANVLQSCPMDSRVLLASNIMLSGNLLGWSLCVGCD